MPPASTRSSSSSRSVARSHELGERMQLGVLAAHAAAERSQYGAQLCSETIRCVRDALAIRPLLREREHLVVEPEALAVQRGRTITDLAIVVGEQRGIEALVLRAGVLAEIGDEPRKQPQHRIRLERDAGRIELCDDLGRESLQRTVLLREPLAERRVVVRGRTPVAFEQTLRIDL